MGVFNICMQLHFITQCISFAGLQLTSADLMDSYHASEEPCEERCSYGSGDGFCFA